MIDKNNWLINPPNCCELERQEIILPNGNNPQDGGNEEDGGKEKDESAGGL